MNTLNRKFTYGFEIEGVFDINLVRKLREYKKGKLQIAEKGDGSVNYCSLQTRARNKGVAVSPSAAELNVGVFRSFWEMYHILEMFKPNENYFSDSSCGLHIHIGTTTEVPLQDLIHYERIKRLQAMFSNNEVLSARLLNRYCKKYNPRRFAEEWRWGVKYRFVKNHQSGTLEFRIYSPKLLESKDGMSFLYKSVREITKILVEPIVIKKVSNITIDDEVEINEEFDTRSERSEIVRNFNCVEYPF